MYDHILQQDVLKAGIKAREAAAHVSVHRGQAARLCT